MNWISSQPGGPAAKIAQWLAGEEFHEIDDATPTPMHRPKKRVSKGNHACAPRHEPPQGLTPRYSGLIEELAFLAAWASGMVPSPSAFLRVRQIRRAYPKLAAALCGDMAGKPTPSFPDEAGLDVGPYCQAWTREKCR